MVILFAFTIAWLLYASRHVRAHIIPADESEYQTHAMKQLLEQELPAWFDKRSDMVILDFRPGHVLRLPDTPLKLNGQQQNIAMQIVTGDGPVVRQEMTVDFNSFDSHVVRMQVARDAVTMIKLNCPWLPQGRTSILMEFTIQGDKAPSLFYILNVDRPEFGQLAVVINDEHGNTVPALARLTALQTGDLWDIPGSLSMNHVISEVSGAKIFGPGRYNTQYIPGQFTGPYAVCPAPFDMALPEGEWELRVWRGPEILPVARRVVVQSGKWSRVEVKLKRWIDMPRRGWYSGDDHIHCRMMNSEDTSLLMAYTQATDLHVSNVLQMGDFNRVWYQQRGFGPEWNVKRGRHWLVPGQEDPRYTLGHQIGLNIKVPTRNMGIYCLNERIADELHQQGGLYGVTHVGWNALFAYRDLTMQAPFGRIDFVSIMQGILGTDLYYSFLNLGIKLTATAGTDTGYGGWPGLQRTYVHTGKRNEFKPAYWFDGIKAGRSVVSSGVLMEPLIGGQLPGSELRFSSDQQVPVDIRAMGVAGGSAPAEIRLVVNGEVVHKVNSPDASKTELNMKHSIPVGFGRWVAAHVISHDGGMAHSTPVYLVREGFRHWAFDRVPALVKEKLAVLDEIDQEAQNMHRDWEAGKPYSTNYWARWMGEQYSELQKALTRSRTAYLQLQRIWELEKVKRG
ncbi:MAG: CehA/McbA family metallohydrolase [Armatimonadota bacterium]